MSPANTSDDLPLPDGPTTATKHAPAPARRVRGSRHRGRRKKPRPPRGTAPNPGKGRSTRGLLGRGDRLAAQRGAERLEALRLLADALPLAEINPSQKLQKPGRRRIAARHQHRDDREGRLAGLADQRELALILLGIAEPMRADQDGDGLGAADRVFERRNPAQARTKRAAVEKGAEALLVEPAVQLRCGGAVAAGVAEKNIVSPPLPMTRP